MDIAQIDLDEKPIGIQIFGSDPQILAYAAAKLSHSNADIIDINMGCPAPKITKNGEGAALMKNPSLISKIVKSVVASTTIPITVKIRKGWDDKTINAVEIAKTIEDCGASAITVHGRTREEFYSGQADWSIIKSVKDAVRIPVIGNGDVTDSISAKKMLEETNCDAIMIGRGAQGNPWVFDQITKFIKHDKIVNRPSCNEILDTIIKHMDMMIDLKGKHTGIIEMRKHIAWYIKGLRNSSNIKQIIFQLDNKEEIINILSNYLKKEN
jgi:nifR3 family TIM-barrel protein